MDSDRIPYLLHSEDHRVVHYRFVCLQTPLIFTKDLKNLFIYAVKHLEVRAVFSYLRKMLWHMLLSKHRDGQWNLVLARGETSEHNS